MASKIIYPPNYVEIQGPMVFLAGPIQGAYDWQHQAIDYFQENFPELNIASPRRKVLDRNFIYNDQVDWETFHLIKSDVVMFWLAKEFEHTCRRAYAQTSRFELAEWKMKHEYEGANLVVGIEDGFTNGKYIRRRMSQDCPDVPLLDNLEATCDAVIRLANL